MSYYYSPSTVLTCSGYRASIRATPRLVDGGTVHGLPNGSALEAFEVDAFIDPDPSWMGGEGCWVVPVPRGQGICFDWSGNDSTVTAVLPSVKGCNPLTGLPMEEVLLHQYRPGALCPVHGCELGGGRSCPECGFSWPAQDYIVDPQGLTPLRLDGFRMPDGTVRQFFFTEDELRDVPSHLIGSEHVVPAFGFAFFRRRAPFSRPSSGYWVPFQPTPWWGGFTTSAVAVPCSGSVSGITTTAHTYTSLGSTVSGSVRLSAESSSNAVYSTSSHGPGLDSESSGSAVQVGAGAVLSQELPVDPSSLEDWGGAPEAVMRIYLVFEEAFARRAASGFRVVPRSDGFLAGLPVG